MRILLRSAGKFQLQGMMDEVTAKYYLLNGEVGELRKLLHAVRGKYESVVGGEKGAGNNTLAAKLQLLQIYKMMHMVNKVAPSNPLEFPIDDSKLKSL